MVVGAVDGLLGVALPFAVLASLAVLAWAGLGGAEAWTPSVSAAADAWLIGHGVDVRFAVPGSPFTVTAAALGPALITALCAVRAGRRAAATDSPLGAWVAGLVLTVGAAVVLLRLGTSTVAAPVAWQAVAWPLLIVGLASLAGLRTARPGSRPVPAAVRTGVAAVLLLLAAAAIALTVLLLARFASVIALDESLDAGPIGGLVLTCLQILAMPTFVVWAAAWLVGAGVTLGTGSATGAFAGQIGPLPALPVLGAVPVAPSAWAAAALLVPVLAGFAAAVLARRAGTTTSAVPLGAVTGLVAGALLGVLVACSAGAVGPGRFTAVGPDALLTAGLCALLVGLPAMLGAAVVRPGPRPSEADEAAQ
ncbi:cell division protein PerM [Amnibacterium sp.]|uniref:cell division protein PerM n=1 Tax=Amnibacterium sp. TaxID=1872496 RepID=UPI003F7C959C